MSDNRYHLSAGREDLRRRTPWESLLLAYAAVVPIGGGTAICFLLSGNTAVFVMRITVVWSAAVLCFLSGVRRGLSFRQEGGPLLSQLAVMLWLYALGFISLVVPQVSVSLASLLLGYLTVAILDPIEAANGAAPRYFRWLRPAQMMVPILCLGLLLANNFF